MFKTGFLLLCSLAIVVSGNQSTTTSPITPAPGSSTTTNSSTSTSPPISTSTQVTTTTVTPTPPTPTPPTPGTPETGKWIVNGTTGTNGTHITCIIAQMAFQFRISYLGNDSKPSSKVINLPSNNETTLIGDCGTTASLEQNMTISWKSTIPSDQMNRLTFHFLKNETKTHWALHHLEVEFAREEFPGIKTNSTTFVHLSDAFSSEINHSYRCLKNQQLNLTSTYNETGSEIFVSNLQIQAFRVDDKTSFGYAEDCSFDTPDIVPIAVGCALTILVVIVLAAYLIGRRRSQARGYLSM